MQYHDTYYLSSVNGQECTLEIKLNKSIAAMKSFGASAHYDGSADLPDTWEHLILAAERWLKQVERDWIKANKQVQMHYPLNCRYGIIQNAVVRQSLNDVYRLDLAVGKVKTKRFIKIVESRYSHRDENVIRHAMSAKDFFEYCRIAYIAGQREDDGVDESLSGKEMYKRYADGRHDGLLDLPLNDKEAFANWIDHHGHGGHPWEVKRGGNTTHIDLSVYRPQYTRQEGFKVELRAGALGRLKETICMFLALHESGLPISIDDPEGIRKRLLAQDNLGIFPHFASLHRANQHFPQDQSVYDVLHYDDFSRYKRRLTPFIRWEPLPVLKPKER